MATLFNSEDTKLPLNPEPKTRKPRAPRRLKGKVWIGPDFELTEVEIKELFEAPLCVDPE
jgi:hypothetical protein